MQACRQHGDAAQSSTSVGHTPGPLAPACMRAHQHMCPARAHTRPRSTLAPQTHTQDMRRGPRAALPAVGAGWGAAGRWGLRLAAGSPLKRTFAPLRVPGATPSNRGIEPSDRAGGGAAGADGVRVPGAQQDPRSAQPPAQSRASRMGSTGGSCRFRASSRCTGGGGGPQRAGNRRVDTGGGGQRAGNHCAPMHVFWSSSSS